MSYPFDCIENEVPGDGPQKTDAMAPGRPKTVPEIAQRYRRLLTRIAAAGNLSSIYEAAVILRDAIALRKNYSNWVLTEYRADARLAIQHVLLGSQQRKQLQPPGFELHKKR